MRFWSETDHVFVVMNAKKVAHPVVPVRWVSCRLEVILVECLKVWSMLDEGSDWGYY